MGAVRASRLWWGDVYFVGVMPVDPRDLFRGDYVVLSYEFSRLPGSLPDMPPEAWNAPGALVGREVSVELVSEGDGPPPPVTPRPTAGRAPVCPAERTGLP